jgi:hypothetical protein
VIYPNYDLMACTGGLDLRPELDLLDLSIHPKPNSNPAFCIAAFLSRLVDTSTKGTPKMLLLLRLALDYSIVPKLNAL